MQTKFGLQILDIVRFENDLWSVHSFPKALEKCIRITKWDDVRLVPIDRIEKHSPYVIVYNKHDFRCFTLNRNYSLFMDDYPYMPEQLKHSIEEWDGWLAGGHPDWAIEPKNFKAHWMY